MRVCVAYDCLFPWTVGGHERFMRGLAVQLAATGHAVTFITRRQWAAGDEPAIPGVEVVAVSRDEPLYDAAGRRRTAEAIAYGAGVLRHLARARDRYDVVHLVGFPYFSIPAARLALAGTRTRMLVDWPELWSREYWHEYLGARGRIGHLVQSLCARLTPEAFVFSDLHAARLREAGMRGPTTRLAGPVAWDIESHSAPVPERPLLLFVGRLIPEKRAELVPAVVASAKERIPQLRGLVIGDGPARGELLAEIERSGMSGSVDAPGFLAAGEVAQAMEQATCLLAPTRREGFGLVAVEAAAAATPTVVVRGPDNAMVERIESGVNGLIVDRPDIRELADAVVAIHEAGQPMRDATAAWFERTTQTLNARAVAAAVDARYAAAARP